MKKFVALVTVVVVSGISQVALADSSIICETDRFVFGGDIRYGGLAKAVEKLNATVKGMGNVSQVSAPSITPDGNGYTACVTVTR